METVGYIASAGLVVVGYLPSIACTFLFGVLLYLGCKFYPSFIAKADAYRRSDLNRLESELETAMLHSQSVPPLELRGLMVADRGQ